MKRCHAESYCKQFNSEKSNCHEYCIGYIQLQNIYQLSHMPKKYQYENPLIPTEADKPFYIFLRDWQLNVREHVENGDGLFLISEIKGNGKTSWACKIMNEYFKKVALKNNLRCRGLFINVPDFLRDLKASFDNPTLEFAEYLQDIRRADLVIWDDIGTETPTSFVRDTLYTYINHRYSNEKSQIFTSNVPLEQMRREDWLGERIVSRIIGCTTTIEFVGHDRRLEP